MADARWGHKITISIYVEGEDQAHAVRAAEHIAVETAVAYGAFFPYPADFVGASVEPVQDRPVEQ